MFYRATVCARRVDVFPQRAVQLRKLPQLDRLDLIHELRVLNTCLQHLANVLYRLRNRLLQRMSFSRA
jgi:hypothetical protein